MSILTDEEMQEVNQLSREALWEWWDDVLHFQRGIAQAQHEKDMKELGVCKHGRLLCFECNGVEKPDSKGWWWFKGKYSDTSTPVKITKELDVGFYEGQWIVLRLFNGKFIKAIMPE